MWSKLTTHKLLKLPVKHKHKLPVVSIAIDSTLSTDMCQDPKMIRDPSDPGSGILEELGSYICIFSWDLIDLGLYHGNIAVGAYGSWISDRNILLYPGSGPRRLSSDLADPGS